MTTETSNAASAATEVAVSEVERRLREELEKIVEADSGLRPEWEPLLDSKRVVGSVLILEDIYGFKIPPDKIVKKGGYKSVDEAVKDILRRVEEFRVNRATRKAPK